jgi:tetratricopeptide (TPR) repeat protein
MTICVFALLLAQGLMAPDPAQLAAALEQEAATLYQTGQYEAAERLGRRALRNWEEVARTRPINLAVPHANLSHIYLAQGKITAGEREARLAGELCSTIPAKDAAPVLIEVEALRARIESACGRYAEAEEHQKAVVAHFANSTVHNPAEAAKAISDLAVIAAARADFRRARPLAETAVEMLRRAGRAADADYGRMLGNLALICYRQGDFSAADPLYREAIAVLDGAIGKAHPHVGMLLAEYAQLLRKTGRKAEAKPLARRAKAILAAADLPGRYTVDARALRK